MRKVGLLVFAAALIVGLIVSNLFSLGKVSGKFSDLSGFNFNFRGTKGSGHNRSEFRDVRDFKSVDVGGVFHVEVTEQKDFSVEVEADDNLLPMIKTEVRGGKLEIETDGKISPKSTIRIRISAPNIEELEVSGVANVTVNDLKNANFAIDSSGASKIKVAGTTSGLTVDVSGATKVDADALTSSSAEVEASGASHVYVNVSGNLRADASGASHITYSGSPTNVEKKSSGASRISPK